MLALPLSQNTHVAAIAILLSGELRTFPTLLPNFEAAVLRPLRPVDTYLHVSLTWTIAAWNNMTGLPDPPSHVLPGALALIRERLRPVWVRITKVSNAAAHFVFVRWRELYAAMKQHERESQITYEHVLRTRPDLVYYCHLDRSWLTRLEAPLLSWDSFIFFRRNLAHVILHLASKTFECWTRIELCVPSALVRLANQSYYDIPANFDLRVASHPQLASIYRHADCSAGLDHCFEHERVRGRSRCSARYCNEPPAAAAARAGAAAAAGLHLPHSMLTIQLPTCVIWGMKDIALPPDLIDGLGEFVPKLTIHRIKNGSHWLVHEQPLRVAGLIEDFLRDDKAARPVSERTKVVRAVRAPRTQRY